MWDDKVGERREIVVRDLHHVAHLAITPGGEDAGPDHPDPHQLAARSSAYENAAPCRTAMSAVWNTVIRTCPVLDSE